MLGNMVCLNSVVVELARSALYFCFSDIFEHVAVRNANECRIGRLAQVMVLVILLFDE